jgi:hypothetical protein
MTKFYFNVRSEIGVVQDEEGQELPDLAAAAAEAVRSVEAYVAEAPAEGLVVLEVANSSGSSVVTVNIGAVAATDEAAQS